MRIKKIVNNKRNCATSPPWKSLKDIQKSMNNLSKEVAELKTSFKHQESELKTPKESLNAALKYKDQQPNCKRPRNGLKNLKSKITSLMKIWTR